MNIFATSDCPRECAEALDDKRVGKMLMEANQMLSQAVKRYQPLVPVGDGLAVRGTAYQTHPCTLWAGTSRGNFTWLLRHAYALSDVFQTTYGQRHASSARTSFLQNFEYCIPEGEQTPFVNCARNVGRGLDFTHLDVITAYRVYLSVRWNNDVRPVTWTNREVPSWRLWDLESA